MFSDVTGVPAPGDEQAGNATIEEMGWELFRIQCMCVRDSGG